MAEVRQPSPVKLFIGTIFASEGILIAAKEKLKKKFGLLDFQSSSVPFNFTDYYEQELGPKLWRQFFSFQRLIDPAKLAAIKLYTNRLEKQFSRENNKPSRRINLDPGYICGSKLVLATAKDFVHRIYLRQGIYAQVTLYFQDGKFNPYAWTYPDYKSKAYSQSFQAIRELYLKQLPR